MLLLLLLLYFVDVVNKGMIEVVCEDVVMS